MFSVFKSLEVQIILKISAFSKHLHRAIIDDNRKYKPILFQINYIPLYLWWCYQKQVNLSRCSLAIFEITSVFESSLTNENDSTQNFHS